MSFIMRFLGASLPARDPDDERWWSGAAQASVVGIHVDADTALKISTVYACVGLLSETIASLPLLIYRYMENEDGRERARNHPLYALLHDQPNATQTAFDFVQMMQAHALLRGSGYAIIKPGARGFVDALQPLHPDGVRKEKLANGLIRYQVRGDDGRETAYNNEDIFEVGGLSLDGWNTVSVVAYALDSFGLTLAAERYGGRFFRNDTRPGGLLKTAGKLSEPAAKRLKSQWEAAHSGGNQHRVAVLEEGLEWQQIGISPEEAQFLQTREFQAEDVCRWFRVPPHMVGLTSKATSWGSGIEQMAIGFLTYTLRPWLTRWTQAIKRDLILVPQTYFADFVVEHLLRGDISSRYNAYAIGRQWGWLSVNEIRKLENMNGIGATGNIYLEPLNMQEAGAGGQDPGAGGQETGAGGQGLGAGISQEMVNGQRSIGNGQLAVNGHYRLLVEESAARVVRKEIAAMTRAAQRCEGDETAWGEAVREFYTDKHAAFVALSLRMDPDLAKTYVDTQVHLLVSQGPAAMEDWLEVRVRDLVELAVGDWPSP